jgi:hypothetical protein
MPDRDHSVNALLVMAQQGTYDHQSFGPFATASKINDDYGKLSSEMID